MSINYLSPLVEKQLPGFVREENPNFVTFLEKYYEWMETSGKPIYENYNLLNAKDVDLANEFFIKQIKEELLPSFPEEILLDDVKFLKTINQFYRSKGTPDSIKFLFKILYNEDIDIYFPSNEILKLSDGKWVLPLALRVETTDTNVFNLVKTQIRGTTSDATAVVEKVVSSVDRALGVQYIELFVSNVNRLFATGETLTSSYIDGEDTITVNMKLIGSLSEIKIDPKNRGLFYKDNDPRGLFYYPEDVEIQYGGDPVTFVGGLNEDENANPKPAEAVVGEVLKGQINEIITIDGGFGFRRSIYPNTSIIDFKGGFASGRLGQESKAEIILVDEKTYRTINVSNYEIQSFYANTINSIDNVANNKTINEITTKQSLNLYPIAFLSAVSSGGGYSSRPDIETYSLYNESLDDELVISSTFVTRKTNIIRDNSQDLTDFLEKGDIIRLYVKNRFEQVETVQQVTSNTITIGSSFETNINNLQVYKVHRRNLTQLGSLGRIKILNGGSNYNVGDYLVFTANGRGYGANAQVTQVHVANSGIKAVQFNETSAYVRGGEGYTSKEFPIITVNSANGANAQLVVSEILGDGEKVEISTSRIGAVSKIKVISYGYDYTSAPIVSLRNADLYLSNVTEGLLFTSNSKVYQGTSNTNTTFEAYFDKYVSGNSHVRIFNYIGTFDDTKQLKSFDDTISADIYDYVFFGNGKAKATAKFENGLIRYPGIYLNEDGQPSSEKRFQDSNKYHNFSYVINTENDYKKFSKTLSDVLHPTGTKSFVTRIKKFDNDVASLVITSNNFITTPLSNTFNVFVGTGIAVVTGDVANVNLASSIAVGDTIVFRNLLKTLNGTVSYVTGSNTITGNGTNFINDLYDGQVIKLVSGNSETVAYVTNANSIITQNTLTSTVTDGTISLYYDEVDTVTFVNSNTIFVSTLFEDAASFVSANLKIDLGAASSLRDIRTTLLIPSINVYAGEANNFTPVSATGGIGGISKYLISPVLPDGLVMISSNGNIRGTPTVLRTPTTYTVTALDKRSRGANVTFTLGINPAPLFALQSIASRTISANTLATTFKPVVPSGGYGSFRYTITPSLPAGVTFDPYSGDIGGIPGALVTANTYTISMVDDVGQNASNTFALTVSPLPIITSTIIASRTLTANITNAFTPVTSTGGYGGLTYEISPSLPSGLTFNTANGYISGNTETTLIANTFTVTANDITGQSTSNTFTLTISLPEPITASQIIDTRTLTANTGDSFTPVTASGGYGNLTYSITPSLPTGLTFNTSNGYISGVTSVLSSNTNYTISLVDEYIPIQTSSNTFFMNVAPPALTSTMGLVTRNLVTGIANSFNTLTASGGYGQITYGISPSLPSGLSLNTSNGFISGTATANTSLTTYTVTANDQASQTTSNTFTMKVYTQLLTRSLIASRTLNTNVANSFLPIIAVSPSVLGDTVNAYYFDGVDNGVRLPFSGDLDLSSVDHTTEFWIKANSASQTANAIIMDSTQTRTGFQISVGAEITGGAGRISFTPQGSTYKIIATGNYLDDAWHHVACVRYSNTGYIYVDGVLVANSATGAWAGATNSYLFAGQIGRGRYGLGLGTDDTFTGYLTNFRVTKRAVYTSAFTPPTSTLTAVANTVLLINSSSFVDSSNTPISFTAKNVLPTVSSDSTVFSTPAVNLTTGITYSITPSLPVGLTFDTANGFITGNTAQTVIANTYTVTVSDESGQVNNNTFIMNVAPAMSMSTDTTLKYNYIGDNPNFTPATASGGITPYTYSIDGLGGNTIPSGTTLNTSNGKISGTSVVKPDVAASFYPYSSTIKVVATDAVGQQISSANIEFVLPGDQIPTSFTSRAIRSIIANSTYASINIGVVTGGLGNLNAYVVPVGIGESNAALYPLAFSNVVTGMTYSFVPASNTVFISGTPTIAMGNQYDESDNFLGSISEPDRDRNYYVQSFDETRITTKGWNSSFGLDIQAQKFYANTTTSTLTFNTGDIVSSTPITVSGGYGINGNITFAISGNTLPTGLEFITSNGAIVGVAAENISMNTFTITANDDSFQTASNTFILDISPTPIYATIDSTAFANTYSYQFNSNTHIQNITAYQTSVAANLRFNSSDITVEFWMKAPSTQNLRATITETQYNLTNTPFGSYIGVGSAYSGTAGKINWMAGHGTSKNTGPFTSNTLTSTTTVTDNVWHHIACVKSGNYGYLFVDGVLESMSDSWTGLTDLYMEGARFGTGIPPQFPSAANNWAELKYTGYLSNFRILKGTALYTNNFTVPNTTLTAIANTALLIFQDSTVIDRSNDNISVSKLSSITGTGIIPVSNTVIPPLNISYTDGGTILKTIQNNVAISFIPIVASGGYGTLTYAISGNTLPEGLTFDTSNGAITGASLNVYTTNTFTITANDASISAANTFALQVTAKPLTLDRVYNNDIRYYNHLQTANLDIYGSNSAPLFTSNGGVGEITFEVTDANTLPDGTFLYTSNTTTISAYYVNRAERYVYLGGVPTELKANNYTITSNDSVGQSISNTVNVTVQAPLVGYSLPSGSDFTLGLTATNIIVMTATGGYGNISYELTANTLPTGLTFISTNAAIMGTPSVVQDSNTYTITGITNSGIYYANVTANITLTTTSATPANVMSFNEAGSGFDEFDGFTWQGLLPNDSTQLVLSSATPFTVEFWMKADAIPSAFIINTDSVNTGGAYSNGVNFWYNNGESFFSINGSGSGSRITTGAVDIFDNQWHHIALVRNGSSGKMFIDGIQQASTTSWGGINSTLQYAFIGNYQLAGDVFFGKLSNFRVTKTALYTTDFTVPSLPLVPITNTVLLLNSDTTYDSSNNHLAVVALNVDPTYETGYI